MSTFSVRIVIILMLLLLITAVGLKHFYGRSQQASETITQLERQLEQQQHALQEQSALLEKFNQLVRETQHRAAATEAKLQESLNDSRLVLKKEKMCDYPVPATVVKRLYDYAQRLRADALSATASDTNSTDYGPPAATTLTYCQAVLWIEPLLAAIERANDQLAALRAADQQRHSASLKP